MCLRRSRQTQSKHINLGTKYVHGWIGIVTSRYIKIPIWKYLYHQNMKMEISLVSPVYKAETTLDELVERITKSIRAITQDYQIILVYDCSPDGSWEYIKRICEKDNRVKGLNLSRNFGQHYAITAGLTYSKGHWVVVMDCDLQDRPEEIPNLYKKAHEGYDSVFAQRTDRQDGWTKRMSSTLFYLLLSYLTGSRQDKSVANFGIYSRKVVNAILSMHDNIRYFPIMAQWVGFKKAYLPVEHNRRMTGKSGYNIIKLMRLAADNMIGFSNKPLRLMLRSGFVITCVSLILTLYYFLKWAFGNVEVDGFTTLVMSVWLALGLLSMMIGVAGLYIGKIFDNVKDRPSFILRDTLNIETENND